MVYYGPSRGCLQCRRRKVRCDLTSPECRNCRKRGLVCGGPRISSNQPDFRPLKLLRTGRDPDEWPAERNTTQSPWYAVPTLRQESPISDNPDSPDEVYFINTIFVPHLPKGGSYGNARVGVFESSATLFELIDLWQRKFLSRSSTGTAGMLSKRADLLSSMALFDDCKGYAWLSSMASYHNILTGSSSMTQVQMMAHAQAVTNLREKFEQYSTSLPLLASLNSLINAEFAAGDYSTAAHHTKFLADELKPDGSASMAPLMSRIRHTVIVLELERAMATFSEPIFDISAWISHDLAQDLATSRNSTLSIRFPSSTPADLDDEALSDPRIIDVVARLRHFDRIFDALERLDTVDRGLAFQVSWASLQVGNDILLHCLDLWDVASHYAQPSAMILNEVELAHLDRCQHTAAALASMYCFRLRVRCEQSDTRVSANHALLEKFWSIAPRIASRMETLLRKSEASMGLLLKRENERLSHLNDKVLLYLSNLPVSSVHPSIRLRLWLLYVGTRIEATTTHGQESRSSYFKDALSDLRDRTLSFLSDGNARQQALEKILAGFIVLDSAFDADRKAHLKQGPEWLSPALRTWGFANWGGELA